MAFDGDNLRFPKHTTNAINYPMIILVQIGFNQFIVYIYNIQNDIEGAGGSMS
jgi:hypothetical protein